VNLDQTLSTEGYAIINNVYSTQEVAAIVTAIENSACINVGVDVFAIRRFLLTVPAVQPLIFSAKLKNILHQVLHDDYFVIKSIYFDKPASSNWFVAWHQDLTVSVEQKAEAPGFTNWTRKGDYFAVQPPVSYLQNIVTVRIHLDDTDSTNGALNVIPGSHLDGVIRSNSLNFNLAEHTVCNVGSGGLLLMKPLLFHSSSRRTRAVNRRVIHIEITNQRLSSEMRLAEMLRIRTDI
jgi:ectoine hydroxylase-related dioxygenase (phytanoyl-CoA dioxygenase family)